MERHLNENQLALYVDGMRLHRLDSVPNELREHVQECFECKEAVMEIAAAVPDRAYNQGEPHPYFDRGTEGSGWIGRFGPALRWAASVILLIGAGSLAYYFLSQRAPTREPAYQTQRQQPPQAVPSREGEGTGAALAQADNFRPLPFYERLTTEQVRSGGSIEHQPANGDTIAANQLFRWAAGTGSGPYSLTILDNHGKEAAHATVRDQSYRLTDKPTSGLYYWKVEQSGELVFVGKFYVAQ